MAELLGRAAAGVRSATNPMTPVSTDGEFFQQPEDAETKFYRAPKMRELENDSQVPASVEADQAEQTETIAHSGLGLQDEFVTPPADPLEEEDNETLAFGDKTAVPALASFKAALAEEGEQVAQTPDEEALACEEEVFACEEDDDPMSDDDAWPTLGVQLGLGNRSDATEEEEREADDEDPFAYLADLEVRDEAVRDNFTDESARDDAVVMEAEEGWEPSFRLKGFSAEPSPALTSPESGEISDVSQSGDLSTSGLGYEAPDSGTGQTFDSVQAAMEAERNVAQARVAKEEARIKRERKARRKAAAKAAALEQQAENSGRVPIKASAPVVASTVEPGRAAFGALGALGLLGVGAALLGGLLLVGTLLMFWGASDDASEGEPLVPVMPASTDPVQVPDDPMEDPQPVETEDTDAEEAGGEEEPVDEEALTEEEEADAAPSDAPKPKPRRRRPKPAPEPEPEPAPAPPPAPAPEPEPEPAPAPVVEPEPEKRGLFGKRRDRKKNKNKDK